MDSEQLAEEYSLNELQFAYHILKELKGDETNGKTILQKDGL